MERPPGCGASVATVWDETALRALRLDGATEPEQARDLLDLARAMSAAYHATEGAAAHRVAAVERPAAEVEDREHLAPPAQLEPVDVTAAGQARVPAYGVGVRRERLLAVLDDLRAGREQTRGVLVVVAVERRTPGAHHF